MTSQLYREHILDLYKNPLNYGEIKNPTNSFEKNNPLCGDEMKITLILHDNKIKDIKFFGKGCAISIASASLLTENVKNLSVEKIIKMNAEDIKKMLGVDVSAIRIKCVLLSLETLKGAIGK